MILPAIKKQRLALEQFRELHFRNHDRVIARDVQTGKPARELAQNIFEQRNFFFRPVKCNAESLSNFLVLVASTGQATLLSPFNGQKLGETAIPTGTFITPVVANGIMYVLTNEGELVALR